MRAFGTFLALFFCIVAASPHAVAQSPVEIEVRLSPEIDDDFLCWSPVPARARLSVAGDADVSVVLRGAGAGPLAGVVGFVAADGGPITRQDYDPKRELPIVLQSDGSWTTFYVVGLKASDGGKDVAIRAELEDGTAIGQTTAMVRVRKNAESLSPRERNALLSALAQWKLLPGLSRPTRFEDYYTTHDDAFSKGIHSAFGTKPSNFLPWHRAFLLNFERELQRIDPTVALPYWKFDEPAPLLFSEVYLGARVLGTNQVSFALSNPLLGWSTKNGVLLSRGQSGAATAPMNTAVLSRLACAVTGCPDIFRETTDGFEMNYHNGAHGHIGGWLTTGTSPRDPLFFLLHANVDRGWAHWQEARDRYDGANKTSYTPEGIYPGSVQGGLREGLYANDPMWPWGIKQGDWGTPADPADDWLPYRFAFPGALGFPFAPDDYPTPARMIDYMGLLGGPELGFCYDDIGYTGDPPEVILEQVQ